MFTENFTGIDQPKWERIIAAVKDKTGIIITSNVGNGSAKGITISWIYSPIELELSVTLLKRSFYDPSEGEIDTDLKTWIGQA